MRKLIYFIVCMIFFLFIRECFAEKSNLILVPEDAGRVSYLGLSIMPPKGEGWYVIQNSPNGGLNFTKNLDDVSHTLVCALTVISSREDFNNHEEFFKYVKKQQERNMGKRRYKNMKNKYQLCELFSDFSVEYQISVMDTKRKSSDGVNLVMKMHGYTFIHPEDSSYIVDIAYSERGISEFFTPSFETIGKEFIDNLIIEK